MSCGARGFRESGVDSHEFSGDGERADGRIWVSYRVVLYCRFWLCKQEGFFFGPWWNVEELFCLPYGRASRSLFLFSHLLRD